jgi:hypothetical protein
MRDLYHEMELRVLDPTEAGTNGVASLLDAIHRHLVYMVFPRVFDLPETEEAKKSS